MAACAMSLRGIRKPRGQAMERPGGSHLIVRSSSSLPCARACSLIQCWEKPARAPYLPWRVAGDGSAAPPVGGRPCACAARSWSSSRRERAEAGQRGAGERRKTLVERRWLRA
ncbi:hypothetical protein GQ55_7G133800 [Panicum hallii var. hallii]|uniref:Uncharacterized protein n=1 Tax=Panicum hallii var. hallii TaxID=1504633 RepID=A0A2T7CUR3_9POAL|nr:hypothetical protein GQ55_7G133800 [Panicum hallii var. hallii]